MIRFLGHCGWICPGVGGSMIFLWRRLMTGGRDVRSFDWGEYSLEICYGFW